MHGASRAEARDTAERMLALVGLDPSAAGRFPHEFSGGQRQRIGLARALALEPAVLVADEPVSALDVSVQAQVLRLLAELKQRLALSLVFITHDLRVAAQVCDRILVMHRGVVVEQGETAAIFAAPAMTIPGPCWPACRAAAGCRRHRNRKGYRWTSSSRRPRRPPKPRGRSSAPCSAARCWSRPRATPARSPRPTARRSWPCAPCCGNAFPTHGIWGEEFGPDRADAEYLWVLDPIDGTRAFVTGRPLFGTLIGLLHHGVPILGLIDQPGIGERWIGAKGRPTRFRSPLGGTAGCRPCPMLAEAELSCTSPDMFEAKDRPGFERLRVASRRVTWGGDCYSYGLMALGLIDIVAECTMKPWDWAALVPVVEGAGGRVTGWAGEPLTLDSDGRVLAVGDPALLPEAIAHLATRG